MYIWLQNPSLLLCPIAVCTTCVGNKIYLALNDFHPPLWIVTVLSVIQVLNDFGEMKSSHYSFLKKEWEPRRRMAISAVWWRAFQAEDTVGLRRKSEKGAGLVREGRVVHFEAIWAHREVRVLGQDLGSGGKPFLKRGLRCSELCSKIVLTAVHRLEWCWNKPRNKWPFPENLLRSSRNLGFHLLRSGNVNFVTDVSQRYEYIPHSTGSECKV